MLDSWNQSIFSNIKHRLQNSAMKLVHAERNGEAFDSQLVIGVRESYGNVYLYFQLIDFQNTKLDTFSFTMTFLDCPSQAYLQL